MNDLTLLVIAITSAGCIVSALAWFFERDSRRIDEEIRRIDEKFCEMSARFDDRFVMLTYRQKVIDDRLSKLASIQEAPEQFLGGRRIQI
jgi:hypothetical protein